MWPVQHDRQTIQDIAAKDSDLLVHEQKLPSEGLVEKKKICPDHISKTLGTVKSYQFVRAGALNAERINC
jgi:hypothetical protein